MDVFNNSSRNLNAGLAKRGPFGFLFYQLHDEVGAKVMVMKVVVKVVWSALIFDNILDVETFRTN